MKHVYYGLVPSLFVVYGVVEKDNASSSVRQKNVPRFLNFHETVNGRSSSYHITPAVAAIASVSRKPTAKNARELFLPPISLYGAPALHPSHVKPSLFKTPRTVVPKLEKLRDRLGRTCCLDHEYYR
ncbi:hypothetical protein AcW1_010190 [Taiwanofungus camphoratus]|nr:hypothetical protein AcW1_010190 [Antrodia cinnamomea]KAI0954357.1 hypothetical protein AcV7_007616 [Antrodia cinnamomea]